MPTFSSLVANATGTDATSFTTDPITPTANRLILVSVNAYTPNTPGNIQPPIPTVTGNGITYTLVKDQDVDTAGTDRGRLFVFRGMAAAPTAGGISINFGAVNIGACAWSVAESSSDVDTSGVNGAGAIVQSDGATSAVAVTTLSVPFPVAMQAGNSGYFAVGVQVTGAHTPRSGWTEIVNVFASACGLETQYRNGTDTDGGSTFPSSRAGAIVIEVKAASTPPPPVAVGRSLSTLWTDRTRVTDNLATSWNILSAAAVGRSLSTSWRVAATVVKDLSTRWHVTEGVIPPPETNHKRVVFPTYRTALGRGKLFGRYLLDQPKSLVKVNGEWFVIITPAQELLEAAEKYFIGGYTYVLTEAEATALGIPAQYLEDVA